MTDTSNMPLYESHKKVHALEIRAVGQYHTNDEGKVVRKVSFADNSSRDIGEEVFRRYVPTTGDFYVVYEDGYESFSPGDAFRGGYKAIDDRTFADIKQGLKISRPPRSDMAAGTNRGDGVALTSASHPGDPFKGQE